MSTGRPRELAGLVQWPSSRPGRVRSLDADSLTVQAVVTKLGVDRRAIRRHVSDWEALLEFVAKGELSDRLSVHDRHGFEQVCLDPGLAGRR